MQPWRFIVAALNLIQPHWRKKSEYCFFFFFFNKCRLVSRIRGTSGASCSSSALKGINTERPLWGCTLRPEFTWKVDSACSWSEEDERCPLMEILIRVHEHLSKAIDQNWCSLWAGTQYIILFRCLPARREMEQCGDELNSLTGYNTASLKTLGKELGQIK